MLQYKIVETSTVTDDELERIVNEWVETGWVFEGFQFVVRESSKASRSLNPIPRSVSRGLPERPD